MHPYRMQTLIRQRGKDQVANVAQRNSVYQTIEALERAGLIVARGTSRDENRPERTVYEATAAGRAALRDWVRTGLSTPAREFPEFPAVLSTTFGVDGPADFAQLLAARVEALEARRADLEQEYPGLPRLFLLENEYLAAITRAEIRWLRGVIADLESGALNYPTEEELRAISTEIGGPSDEAIRQFVAKKLEPSASPAKRRGARS